MRFIDGVFRRFFLDQIRKPQEPVVEQSYEKVPELSNELLQPFVGGQLRWKQGDTGQHCVGEVREVSYSPEAGIRTALCWAATPHQEKDTWVSVSKENVCIQGTSSIGSSTSNRLRIYFMFLSEEWEFAAPGHEFINPAQILCA